ncbi:protein DETOXIFICATION 43-like isoform X1 [Camellia sinensis]|uniref:protein DETOXIFICATION 43-like isoform X1 n=1 Tax=Camellia sinensis TaxID=4442 RepID=UPI001035B779|nr:protein DETOXIFICATION 43-like isoform X1 [Camellia sinensis]XP_028091324.1 protein DETOXIFICATION 43-like isoform X1 [Camellia sinensis]XP_028091325.1 protein DETOXIFICATION 43-like isoform X1 [Camellia sinensis]XP_028091326.1 protein DETOXIFICATION 43-like isoform X1 [Camellia sinensis]
MAKNGDMPVQERKWKLPPFIFFKDARHIFKLDALGVEILQIAFPAALALAADPIASLIDTAFIGRLGPVPLAAVGVSIAIFNQASKVTIFPLVSITTSFVAEEDTVGRINREALKDENTEKISAKKNEMKQLTLEGVVLENLEEGLGTICEMKELMPEEDFKTTGYKSPTVTTSSPKNKAKLKKEKRHIPSASTAILLGCILGILQTIFLIFLAKPILSFMGVKSSDMPWTRRDTFRTREVDRRCPNCWRRDRERDRGRRGDREIEKEIEGEEKTQTCLDQSKKPEGSPMLNPAQRYLTLRALGAPAVLLSLAMQGVFRGFKDTRTPLYATVAGDSLNIILDPILIFVCHLGVNGAAIAHVLSQYLISVILLCKLMQKVVLLPPSVKDLQFSRFLKNGFLLLARVIAVTFCVTLAASLAARLGTTPMAAFQICLQVWMTSSLLSDGLAVAGQAILACAFAEKDYVKAKAVAARVLQMGFVLGLGLTVVVGLGLQFGSGIFTKDKNVVHLISIGIPFVAATQPINSLAFVFDGVNFGASDFIYSAYSMVLVSVVSIASLFLLWKSHGFVGIWFALTIYMGLRAFAGIWRMGTGTGPWRFLRGQSWK